ncbi:MAG TPA: M43 family zinc metalloprotease [Flavipsychrobacter sp.]|mgnify:CR=1 FL=1|nr:M43 family zinc metalloprotease [Flavipsychrobacter sp.]
MLKRIYILVFSFFWGLSVSYGQTCGFDATYQQAIQNDPVFAQQVQQMRSKISNFLQSHSANNSNSLIVNTTNGPVYEIPVVIHVIHTGGPVGSNYNPSTTQLTNMINYLNQTYAATWPAYANTSNGGVAIPIRFALAQRDPNCAATTGIVRVDGSSLASYVADGMAHNTTNGAAEATVKALSKWPKTEYYNIWIVNKIDGQDGFNSTGSFVAGFAWFPGASANVDGTVMLAYTSNAGQKTLPHEVGHAFSLWHTFEGDNGGASCPTNNNCNTDGDEVCDTDPHMRSVFNCTPLAINSCVTPNAPLGDVVKNIMDYSGCPDLRFTTGQANRVVAALFNTDRSNLISSLGATPITSTVVAANCAPPGITNTGGNRGPRDIIIADANFTYMSVSSSGYSGDGNQYYIDKSCKHMAEVTSGNSYNFDIQTGGGSQNVKVYIDYNNDGIFQSSEQVYSHSGSSFNEVHSFTYTAPSVLTVPSLVSCTPLRMRIIGDNSPIGTITACSQLTNGQVEDYAISIKGGGPVAGAVTIAMTQGSNPSCFFSPLTFTATPGNGVSNPTYSWLLNGNPVGASGSVYNSINFNNGDTLSVMMQYIGACGFDTAYSNKFIVYRAATIPAAVSIALLSGNNPGCAGQTLVFKATPTNGGSTPAYQWKVNGSNAGGNADTFAAVLNNNDAVTVEITSNSSCAVPTTATSNSITVTHAQITASVTIAASTTLLCAGQPVTVTSNITNGGSNPQYQWFVNNTAVTGATSSMFTTTALSNNDSVSIVYYATDSCVSNATDTSNFIVMGVAPVDTTLVSVAITKGSNPGCLDSLIEFTATASNFGANPIYEWYLNGNLVGTGLVYNNDMLTTGDQIIFVATTTDGKCYTKNSISDTTVMALFTTPAAPVISLIGNMLVSNLSGNLQWFGPNGLIPGATGQTHHPDSTGYYYAVTNNNGCYSRPSNILLVSLTSVGSFSLSQVAIYPNPTKGQLTFDWSNQTTAATIKIYSLTGNLLQVETVNVSSKKTVDLSHFANGAYYVMIIDEQGKTATVPVVLNKN